MKKWNYIGTIISFAWLAYMGYLLWPQCAWLRCEKINEVGDFFAGAFAPLAFLWLILGYRQQGEELRNSREALLMQAEELKNSVEQQRELAAAAKQQASIESRRLQAEREAHLAELQKYSKEQARAVRDAQPVFTVKNKSDPHTVKKGRKGNEATVTFQLENIGASTTIMAVTVDGHRSENNAVINSGEAITIMLGTVEVCGENPPSLSSSLCVDYLDAQNVIRQSWFECSVRSWTEEAVFVEYSEVQYSWMRPPE